MRRRTIIWFAALVGLSLASAGAAGGAEAQLDLNRATLEEISQLPISPEDARAIWERKEYHSYFGSVYDLLKIPGITTDEFMVLKPLVKIVPVLVEDTELQRVNEIYFRIRQWEAEEGASEAITDYWIDLAKDPVNVNDATYEEIANLQAIPPTDAAAIYAYTRRNRVDQQSALRNIPGLTYWGYYNARNFVRYQDPVDETGFRGSYQYRVSDAPDFFDITECLAEDRNKADGAYDSWWNRLDLESASPVRQHKIRGRWGRDIRAGALIYQGSQADDDPDAVKYHVTVQDQEVGPVHLDNVIVGNYAVAFGQGLVMQNTDYLSSRNTGYGWDKRYIGILGDLSPTQEFALHGAAAEATLGNVKGILFYSDDWKDAVLNPDGTVNQYIIMSPRVENEDLEAGGLRPMRDVLHERTFGGNLKYVLGPGTWVAVSGYESRYNKYFRSAYDPDGTIDVSWMVNDTDEDKLSTADSEYWSCYTSPGKFRRVYGADFQWVHDNVVLAGEYAGLDSDGKLADVSDDPKAFVVNAYASYSNLTLLALYRDYDLAFDNPYNRGFAEYSRFKGSILEDQYYLADPIYGLLYDNSATPQAERGLYLESRYRYSDRMTPSFEYDVWERKSDGADYSRLVFKVRFQPIYNIIMTLRQKWQGRLETNWFSPVSYEQVETRFNLEYRLSDYDEVEFLVSRAWIAWPPRPRLTYNPEPDGGHPEYGSAAVPSYAVGATITHNFSDWLRLTTAATYYDGFLWTFEDSEFAVMDGRALRYWISISDRLSDHMALKVRWTNDHAYPLSYVDPREYNVNPPDTPEPDGWYVREDASSFKVQLDYSW